MPEVTSSRPETRARIVEVAGRLLHAEGPAGVTTRAVAEGARVQAPTIYRLFGDKDGLLEAVAEHVMATHVSAKAAQVATAVEVEADPLEDLRTGWAAQVEFALANPSVFRLLSEPARVLRSPAAQEGQRVLESRVRRVAAAGRLRVREERAVDLFQAAGLGVISTLLATPPGRRDPGLPDAMLEAVLDQILVAPDPATPAHEPGVAGRGLTASVVTLRASAPELDGLSEAERRLLVEWLDRVVDRRPEGTAP